MESPPPDLLIVYNARSGVFSALADALHKAISPDTYPCSLCAVTYGAVSMRGEWRAFLDRLPGAKRFYHSDDFAAAFPGLAIRLPAILVQQGSGIPRVLVDAGELNTVTDLAALMAMVGDRLRTGAPVG